MNERPAILISGMLAGVPHQGGASWAALQYLLGFRDLGFPVCFLEPVDEDRIRPAGCRLEDSSNAIYFGGVAREFDLLEHAALVDFQRSQSVGMSLARIRQVLRESEILINLAGTLPISRGAERIPVRVYLDLDPGFSQLWHEVEGEEMRFEGHTHFLTVGLALGGPGCSIPSLGLDWQPTLQPVVLARWPAQRGPGNGFTTVANWRSYGSIEYRGRLYGQKAHSWRSLMNLPRLVDSSFRVALSIHPDESRDLEELRRHGWQLVDPREAAGSPESYRDFIRHSRGELAVAKSGYVNSRCGWFSERSACYLSSGRPVVAQGTGFEDFLPCGRGLLVFGQLEEAVEAIREIEARYAAHSRAARAVAEEHFDSRRVLRRLLSRIGAGT